MNATRLAVVIAVLFLGGTSSAQQGEWAAATDVTAKSLIDMERQWAETDCTHNMVEQTILADDFVGTSPGGKLYTKKEAIQPGTELPQERDCRLIDAKVRFFGENMAMVYGSESAIRKTKDGAEETHCMTWTDTWLKRSGKWQIIAAQDMRTCGTMPAAAALPANPPQIDPVKQSPQYYTVRINNERLRVLEYHLKSGQKEPMHSHPPGIVYYISDATFRITLPDGSVSDVSVKAGEVHWREATTHASENIGATEGSAIAVELKPVAANP